MYNEIQLSYTQARNFTQTNFASGDVYNGETIARMIRYALGSLGAGKYYVNAWNVLDELVRNAVVTRVGDDPQSASYTIV